MSHPDAQASAQRPASWVPSFALGVGLGGFVDGIVLHQLLQWHHMVSAVPESPMTTLAGLQLNTTADGLFHAAAWVLVVLATTGLVVQWRQGRRAPSRRFHGGLLLAGWGAFNLVEGVVDHQLLGLHHVRDDLGGPLSWDVGFLVVAALQVVVGALLVRSGPARSAVRPPGSAPTR